MKRSVILHFGQPFILHTWDTPLRYFSQTGFISLSTNSRWIHARSTSWSCKATTPAFHLNVDTIKRISYICISSIRGSTLFQTQTWRSYRRARCFSENSIISFCGPSSSAVVVKAQAKDNARHYNFFTHWHTTKSAWKKYNDQGKAPSKKHHSNDLKRTYQMQELK